MGREIERLLVVFLPCSAIVVRDLIETLSGFKNLFERLENFHVFTFHMFYSQKVPSRYIYIYITLQSKWVATRCLCFDIHIKY